VDLTQLQLSQLAADKAQEEQVRQFARRMLDYHGRSYDRLARIAEENGIKRLEEIGLIARTMEAGLRQLSAPLFDLQYINAQVIYHHSAFYRYERESIHGRDKQLRPLRLRRSETSRGITMQLWESCGTGIGTSRSHSRRRVALRSR
jgi:predicted outer membrane protein